MNNIIVIVALSLVMCLYPSGRDSTTGREGDLPAIKLLPIAASDLVYDSAQVDADKLTIRDAWIQEGPPSQKITAAFMSIENHNSAEVSLVSASTDAARVIELHKMENAGGMMRMRQVESITIPAGATVRLEPGGYHLMVIDVNRELKENDQVRVTLRFSNHIQKTINVPVKSRDSMSGEDETN